MGPFKCPIVFKSYRQRFCYLGTRPEKGKAFRASLTDRAVPAPVPGPVRDAVRSVFAAIAERKRLMPEGSARLTGPGTRPGRR